MRQLSRRSMMKSVAALGLGAAGRTAPARYVRPDWQSLVAAYRTPDWFRDAKFGIWSHWGPQCVPEYGDWYGRQMYIKGNYVYEHHKKTYGHPSEFGFIELIGRWKAENWDPEGLMRRYVKAGARYFMSMANHHDNLDNFDSAHHAWNSTRVGPKRDIVGTWEKVARDAGMRFGVSNHSAHAWHWWQTAYGYDAEGPRKGVRYDAYRLREVDGRDTWWEGLDPQELYCGPIHAPPDGIDSIDAMNTWHDTRDGQWMENAPPGRPDYVRKWLLRQMDLVEKYRPDMVYLDDYRLPFDFAGLEAVAHYYNKSVDWHGAIDVVLTAKRLSHYQRHGITEDVERGFVADIQPVPWQTDTCIGNWHYDRGLYERHGYKSAKNVVQRLCDIVSKNGCLLLSIPQRGDGSIDSDEEKILDDLASWFAINGGAIYGTRPWRRFGEGPTKPPEGMQNEGDVRPFVAEDVRFTVGTNVLNALFLEWPEREAAISSLGRRELGDAEIDRIEMLNGRPIAFRHGEDALRLSVPASEADGFVPGVRIMGRGLV